METVLTPIAEGARTEPVAQADGFVEVLRAEQARYLEAFNRARAGLGRGSGQLAHVSAIHSRLTRQFFDAQRSLLLHRAELDAHVAGMLEQADVDAAQTVRRARELVAGGCRPPLLESWPPPAPSLVGHSGAEAGELTPRQQIAVLGRSLLRTKADAEALAPMIDEALQPDEPDDLAFGRSLGALLDDWWTGELAGGRATLADARARADIRRHVAEIEAQDLLVTADGCTAAATPTGVAAAVLSPVARALQTVGLERLRELLAALADSLYPPMESAARPAAHTPPTTDGVLIVLGGNATDLPRAGPLSAPTTGVRWDDGRRRGSDRRGRPHLRLVASAAALSSLVMAAVQWRW